MSKFAKALGITVLSASLLVACGEKETNSTPKTEEAETVTEDTEKEAEEPAEETDKEQEYNEESGKGYIEGLGYVETAGVGYNEEIGIDGIGDNPLKPLEMGTMELEISSFAILEIEPEEDAKDLHFDGKEKVKAIVVDMKAENTAEEDVEFYPNQSVMVTDIGEQVEPEMLLMGEVGGEFLGKVVKEDQTWWLLENTEDEISEVKMIIGAPYSADDWEDMGEEQRLKFEVLSFEDALERDDRE